MSKSTKWDQEDKVKELLRITCKHVTKKSLLPDPEWFPDLICKKCSKRFDQIQENEEMKDLFLLCPDCLSKEIRDKSYWRDWYKIALKHYKSLGFDTIPCMDDAESLKTELPAHGCDCGVCKGKISEIKNPGKPDEFGCYIKQYFHCKKCLDEKPPEKSAAEWARLNVGFTAKGLEVWCQRHNISVVNLDFKGNKVDYI